MNSLRKALTINRGQISPKSFRYDRIRATPDLSSFDVRGVSDSGSQIDTLTEVDTSCDGMDSLNLSFWDADSDPSLHVQLSKNERGLGRLTIENRGKEGSDAFTIRLGRIDKTTEDFFASDRFTDGEGTNVVRLTMNTKAPHGLSWSLNIGDKGLSSTATDNYQATDGEVKDFTQLPKLDELDFNLT